MEVTKNTQPSPQTTKTPCPSAETLNAHLANGGYVQVSTYLQSRIYSPKQAGRFYNTPSGDLGVQNGRSRITLGTKSGLLVGIRLSDTQAPQPSRVELPKPDYSAMQSWFAGVLKTIGAPAKVEPMVFRGADWGVFAVSPVMTVSGRLAIECTPTNGRRSYCISVSRWLSERRAGGIVPA